MQKTLILFSILFVTIVFFIGCSEDEKIVNVTKVPAVIEYNNTTEEFETKEIKYSDLIGEWKLINAKYKCALGELVHIENNYSFEENGKKWYLELQK